MALTPWVLGFAAETAAAWNAWIVGAGMALVAVGALWAFAEWEEWVNLILGAWAVVAPWLIGFADLTSAVYAHVVAGLIVAVASALELWFASKRPMSHA